MITNNIRIGDQAPAFTLKDQDGVPVNLREEWKNQPILLVFYPGDLTPGCTLQLSSLRDEWPHLKEAGVVAFGINHADPATHRTFREHCRFPFRLLSDEGKRVSGSYGAVRRLFRATIIQRTVVGISTDGTICYFKHGMPKWTEVIKAVQAAQKAVLQAVV